MTDNKHDFRWGVPTVEEAKEGVNTIVECTTCDLRIGVDGDPLSPKEKKWAEGAVARIIEGDEQKPL